jgi:uncharacterized caspase-like protein
MKRLLAIFAVLFWSACALGLSGGVAHAERRVALVVGNSVYKNPSLALTNPMNDAQDISNVLRSLGFEVVTAIDATKRDMDLALQKFARLATNSDSALFFYAGHAMQYQGRNYLMPIDAELEDEVSLLYEMTAFDDIRAALDRSNGVKILILDACRNNPLAERLVKSASGANRALGNVRGLARIDKTQGMVVAYATAADDVAVDGTGRNSPFTKALLQRLQEPGLEIEMMFRRVAADVNAQTNGRQRPETYISLLNEYYLNQNDRIAWDQIKDSDDLRQLRDFVNRFPGSPHSVYARNRIDLLERNAREREAQRQQEEEQARRAEAAKKQAEQDAIKKLADERARLQQLEELIRRQIAESQRLANEAAQKQQAEAERQRLENEAAQKQQAEAERQRLAAEAAQKQQTESERQRLAAEAAKKAEAERQRVAAEAAKKQQEEAERQRVAAETAKKQQEETERQRIAAEAAKKQQEEAERQRVTAEAAKKQQEEAERQRVAAEAAKKQREDAERQRLASLAQKQQVDGERQKLIDACNREEQRFALIQAGGSPEEMTRFMGELTCRSLRPIVAEAVARKVAEAAEIEKQNAVRKQSEIAAAKQAAPSVPAPAAAAENASKPVEVALASPKGPELDSKSQILLAQKELRRLGCFAGPESGSVDAATRDAIKRYMIERGQPTGELKVTDQLISGLQAEVSRVCPLTCGRGQVADGDRCIAEPRNAPKPAPVARQQAPAPRPSVATAPRPAPANPAPAASAVSNARPSPMVGIGN